LERGKNETAPLLVVANQEKVHQRRVADDGLDTRMAIRLVKGEYHDILVY
jgi:hypothetical protein